MARPRTVPDRLVLDAAAAIMRQSGPAGITFAAVAAVTGLAPATLVQRYGSKEGLRRAALLRLWDLLGESTLAADAVAPDGPEGAVALLVALTGDYGDREQYAEGLLVLREDIRDQDLRERGAQWGAVLALALGRRLATSPAEQWRLGRLMVSQWQGSLLWWGFSREDSVAAHVERELREWLQAVLRR